MSAAAAAAAIVATPVAYATSSRCSMSYATETGQNNVQNMRV